MITGAIITNIVIKKSRGQQSIALQTHNDYMLPFKQWSKLWLVQFFSDLEELTTFSTFQGPWELCVLYLCISYVYFLISIHSVTVVCVWFYIFIIIFIDWRSPCPFSCLFSPSSYLPISHCSMAKCMHTPRGSNTWMKAKIYMHL